MPTLFSNKNLKTVLSSYLTAEVAKLDNQPILNIVQVGQNLASKKYVSIKKKVGQKIGIEVRHHHFEDNVSENTLIDLYAQASQNNEGFIFQLPLPGNYNHLVPQTPLNTDVDLLSKNSNLLWDDGFLPPTIGAIDLILKEMLLRKKLVNLDNDSIIFDESFDVKKFITDKLDLRGKTVAIVGQGVLVGGPLLNYLRDREATIISINKDTKNTKQLLQSSDIVLSGAGVPHLFDGSFFVDSTIVVDAATSGVNGNILGDVNTETVSDGVYLCPSPRGVGPITVIYIFNNLLKLLAKNENS